MLQMMEQSSTATTARARRALAVYAGLVLLGSGVLEAVMIARGKPITQQLLLVGANMWVPALASIVTRLVLKEGFADVSFRARRATLRELAVAWLYPLPVAFLAYGLAWATKLAAFRGSPSGFIVSLAAMLTVGTLANTLATFARSSVGAASCSRASSTRASRIRSS